jgi:hypothetical protein
MPLALLMQYHLFGSPGVTLGEKFGNPPALQITNDCSHTSGLATFGIWLAVIACSSPVCDALGVLNPKPEP